MVTVNEEHETEHGWAFDVAIAMSDGGTRELAVTLSWVDYDHISGGSSTPAAVVHAIVAELISRGLLEEYADRFDASRAVRRVDGLLDTVRSRL